MIGVKPEGFVRHMDKCIKKTLFASHINSGIPVSHMTCMQLYNTVDLCLSKSLWATDLEKLFR